jgi:hypothetical protein
MSVGWVSYSAAVSYNLMYGCDPEFAGTIMNDQQHMSLKEKIMFRVRELGARRTYLWLTILSIISLGSLALFPVSSKLGFISLILTFVLFGLSGLVLVYFKEMPGLFGPIKGVRAVISGYLYFISSLLMLMILFHSLLTN